MCSIYLSVLTPSSLLPNTQGKKDVVSKLSITILELFRLLINRLFDDF